MESNDWASVVSAGRGDGEAPSLPIHLTKVSHLLEDPGSHSDPQYQDLPVYTSMERQHLRQLRPLVSVPTPPSSTPDDDANHPHVTAAAVPGDTARTLASISTPASASATSASAAGSMSRDGAVIAEEKANAPLTNANPSPGESTKRFVTAVLGELDTPQRIFVAQNPSDNLP
ncbi:hypothetical protein ColTof3_14717 [Colletotrichum tofieldiae]|nr:hypothetical protein ColTof3_14717 [Colletotrichum tofieldiae]